MYICLQNIYPSVLESFLSQKSPKRSDSPRDGGPGHTVTPESRRRRDELPTYLRLTGPSTFLENSGLVKLPKIFHRVTENTKVFQNDIH